MYYVSFNMAISFLYILERYKRDQKHKQKPFELFWNLFPRKAKLKRPIIDRKCCDMKYYILFNLFFIYIMILYFDQYFVRNRVIMNNVGKIYHRKNQFILKMTNVVDFGRAWFVFFHANNALCTIISVKYIVPINFPTLDI